MFGTSVKVAAGAIAASAALAACGPVTMGSAATVGDQRISDRKLNSAVSGWQSAYRSHPVPQQLLRLSDPESLPRSVLYWLISFRVTDEAARLGGVAVSRADVDAFRAEQNSQLAQRSAGQVNLHMLALGAGVPPAYEGRFVRMAAVHQQLARVYAPGAKSQEEADAAVNDALAATARTLHVRVDPRYGAAYDTRRDGLLPVKYALSRAESGTSAG